METAITIAKEKAGLSDDPTVKIVEMPKRGMFNVGAFVPQIFGIDTPATEDETLRMIRFRIDHKGRPLPLVPLDETELWKNSIR